VTSLVTRSQPRYRRAEDSSPATRALPFATAAIWASAIGIAMSTQYLFQPFVWANWPWDEVLIGWLEVIRDRLVVALPIALALVIAARLPTLRPTMRAATLATAIIIGASAGEALLIGAGSEGESTARGAVIGRIVHWCLMAAALAAMYYLWLRITSARAMAAADELHMVQLQRQIAETRLQTLRNQIEPHFLFNTLATVRRLQEAQPAEGSQLLRDLINYLRLTIANLQRSHATLGHEMDLVRAYLGVIEVRMSGRLKVQFDFPASLLACAFPPLTLATLVENAVKHGVGPQPEGGTINITARRADDALEVVVTDSGAGFASTIGTGIGLANVRARLRTLYGTRGQLALESHKPHGVRAAIRLPFVVASETP
jgi:Histidine kinase